jgi:hypothetical protein
MLKQENDKMAGGVRTPTGRTRIGERGINSKESISPAFVAWRVGTTNRGIVMARQAT